VELCAGIPEGGTTPSYGEIKLARRLLTTTRLHVIIRPRGGDFLYTPLELERMETDIRIARELGADSVVFGCLDKQGNIDMAANERLIKAAGCLSATFHRAFDRCCDASVALEQLVELGFDRVLTSGQKPTAAQGITLLRQLNEQSQGRIRIMAGCGVNEDNIAEIQQQTGIREFHFSAREPIRSLMEYSNPDVYMGAKGADESVLAYTCARRVAKTIAACVQ